MENLSPIFIASPVRRSGTTLVQRLLCSSDNAIIYGESAANELLNLFNMYQARILYFQASKKFRDEQLERVLAGEVNEWIPDLMPAMDGYLDALKKSYLSIFHHYREFATQQGKVKWGMKMAEWQVHQLQMALQTFPKSQLLYIYRPLEDCVRSAKRVNMIRSIPELQHFCQSWQQNLNFVREQLPAQQVLLIDYEKLVANPEMLLSEIEQFCGVQNIDRTVMQHRVNTFASQTPGGTGYLSPAELNEAEQKIIDQFRVVS